MLKTPFKNLLSGIFDGLRPEERLTVSEWADKYRYIASGSSPEPGLYRTSRTPYLKKIMDSLTNNTSYRLVVFMKAAQIGASEAGFNWLGYKIDIAPGTIMSIMPTEGQMKRNSKMRIDPMLKSTPRLATKVSTSNRKDASNTILQKDFPGGTLIMAGANSATGLRSVPAGDVLADELDGYPQDLQGEGAPLELLRARTRNFKRGKIYIPSTPTKKGLSAIEREFEKTDKQKFFMPCPHCGTMQHLEWENMRWLGSDSYTAHYLCPHCEDKIYDEEHKKGMLAYGDWIATDPSKTSPEVIGFHANALVSPWYTFSDAVTDFLRIDKDVNKLVVFTNTVLGLPSEAGGDAPKWEDIYAKKQNFQTNKPNNYVKFITAGVDIQKNRIEVQIVGWGKGKRRWVLDYRVLPGLTAEDDEVWKNLEKIVSEFWVREDGLEMPLQFMAVDSGSFTKKVYDFCSKFPKSKVAPVKGLEGLSTIFSAPKSVNKTETGKDYPGVMLYSVGVSVLKVDLYGHLKKHKLDEDELGPEGYIHIPNLNKEYFMGLVAEEERLRYVKGYPKVDWVKIYERNEPLDTMNYARVAASIVGIDRYADEWLDQIEGSYVKKSPAPKKKEDTGFSNKEGGYWD